jgi:hypothetical protein
VIQTVNLQRRQFPQSFKICFKPFTQRVLPNVVEGAADVPVVVNTYAGPVRVEWDPEASVTALDHFAFFVEYLKASSRF